MVRVLLSAVGGPVAVSFIKHLRRQRHQVIGMDSDPNAVGKTFCDRFFVSPPARDESRYLGFLQDLRKEFDVFFPWIDEELATLASHRKHLGSLAEKIVISDSETVLQCVSKRAFQKAAMAKGLNPAPLTDTVPAFVKPDQGRGSKGALLVEQPDLLACFLRNENYLCQRYIAGPEYTVDVLVGQNGEWIFGVPRWRLMARGVSTTGQVDMNEEVIAVARRCVAAFRFRGPINIQVMRQASTRQLYIIEINPRIAGTAILSIEAGFDILTDAIECHFGTYREKEYQIVDKLLMKRYWSEVYEH